MTVGAWSYNEGPRLYAGKAELYARGVRFYGGGALL